MEYTWNVQKIRNHQKQIQSLLRKTVGLSHDEKVVLQQEIRTLQDIEHIIGTNDLDYSRRRKIDYVDSSHLLPITTLRKYTMISSQLKNTIKNSMSCFQNFTDCYEDTVLPYLNLSNKELVNFSYDFYQWLSNKECLKYFRIFMNPRNYLLRFTFGPISNYYGTIIPFYHPSYRAYISINRENTIQDFYTLNHEIAHGIYWRADSPQVMNTQHYYLTELDGAFFEFLTGQYLKGKIDDSMIQEVDYQNFIHICGLFYDFYVIDSAVCFMAREKKIDMTSIETKMLDDKLITNINMEKLQTALYQDPQDNTRYFLSYLTSLDLEVIYGLDPEYAFYLFARIRNNKTENIFQNLRENHITFMDDGYQNLRNKIKTYGRIES